MDYSAEVRSLVEMWTRSSVPTWIPGAESEERRKAGQRIRALNDLRFFDPICATLTATRAPKKRDTLYWMLTCLLRNTGAIQIGEFLMQQVGVEPKKTVKVEILRSIGMARGRGVLVRDASNALEHLSDRLQILREAAVEALGCCADPRAEDALIGLIDRLFDDPTESGWFIHHALRSLSEIATSKSRSTVLKVLGRIDGLRLGTRKRDIKAMAVKTLARIDGPEHLGVFAELLSHDKSPLVKWQAMRALNRFATEEEVALIKKRVRSILGAPRVISQTEGLMIKPPTATILFRISEKEDAKKTELLLAFDTLARLSALSDPSLVRAIRDKWSRLTVAEQDYLRSASGAFSDLAVGQEN